MPRFGRGPLILFVAAAILLADMVLVWIGTSGDFAFDFTCCYQQAGQRALDAPATLYSWDATYTFRYTPLGALFFSPLAGLSVDGATWAWLLVKVVALVVVAAWYSRAWTGTNRWLVAGLVLLFPPIVHDLVIGNISTLTTLVLLSVLRWPDARGGTVLGIMLALAPKPALLPVVVWLALRRRSAFLASLATAAGLVLAGLLYFGVDPWLAFLGTLREPLSRTFTANIGFSAYLGVAGVVLGIVLAAGLFVVAARRADAEGLGLAIISGILLGPYTFIHYLSGVLVAVEPILRDRARWLSPFPWLLILFPLIPVSLLLLAFVEWRHGAEAERPGAAPG
jgi:hypothetical protein